MGGFLTELGKKLAEKWLTLLVLPGLLYVGTLAAARSLGWAHAVDLARLTGHIDSWAGYGHPRTGGFLVLVAVLAVLGGVGAGLAAQALGELVALAWLAERWQDWLWPAQALARRRTEARKRIWRRREAVYRSAVEAAVRSHALAHAELGPEPTYDLRKPYRALNKVALEEPERPTWMGDRIAAVRLTLHRGYALDLATVWPYLWLTFPENVRNEITAARDAFQRACVLAGWGVLYLIPGVLWWPGLLVAVVLWAAAVLRARRAVDAYAAFVEAAVVLHTAELGRALDSGTPGALTQDIGRALTRHLQGRHT